MNKPTSTRKALYMALVSLTALALACGSSNGNDAGPPLSAQAYFNLNPGLCFEYSSTDAGTPTRGLLIQSPASPPGEVSVTSTLLGAMQQIDYLTFDGGTVFLNERQIIDGGFISWVFDTPLTYLQAPLTMGQANIVSGSSYMGTSPGYEILTVSLLDSDLWTGFGADAGGTTSFYMQFSAQDDGGGALTQNQRMLPNVGFVQLYATDENGTFTNFSLVEIRVMDAGVCGE